MKISILIFLTAVCLTHQTVLIADNLMSRMIELSASKPYCTLYNDRNKIQYMLFNSDQIRVRRMEADVMTKLVNICKADQVFPHQGGFIYPGTKWCGPGSIAKNFDDLGLYEIEDKCCRTHDYCPKALASGECRLGICNESPFTRSHCDCDADLRKCLQTINSDTANTIGAIFFNVVQVTCIKERPPCSKWQRNGYDQAESDRVCNQMTFSPSDKYIPQLPLPQK